MKTMSRFTAFGMAVALALLAFAGWGCRKHIPAEGPTPGVAVRDPQREDAQIRYNSFVIVSDSLQRRENIGKKKERIVGKVAIEESGARRSPTNTLEVWATIRNRTDYPLRIQGRVQFFDEGKAPIEGPTAWKTVHLPPNSVGVFKEFSTRTTDAYYYGEIREE